MKYIELTVQTTDEAEELVSDIFWNYTNYGVAVSTLKDVIELTENRRETYDYIDGELLNGLVGVSLVKGYFDIKEASNKKALIMRDLDTLKVNAKGNILVGTLEMVERTVDGDDWIEIWRKHYRPINFGKITVCPRWVKCDDNGFTVYIDSNAAFGTGEHETTSMCVEFIEKYVKSNLTVVDVGTGSGILGISAAKLGAKTVVMTDVDNVAVQAAEHNIRLNNVENICSIYNTNLLEGVKICGNIVVANITADVLKVLANDITNYVETDGIVILSGILKSLKDGVVKTYRDLNFTLIDEKTVGEWSAVVLKK